MSMLLLSMNQARNHFRILSIGVSRRAEFKNWEYRPIYLEHIQGDF